MIALKPPLPSHISTLDACFEGIDKKSLGPGVAKSAPKTTQSESCVQIKHDDAQEFIEMIDGKKDLTCNLQSGLEVIRIIEASRLSNKEGRFVKIDEIILLILL